MRDTCIPLVTRYMDTWIRYPVTHVAHILQDMRYVRVACHVVNDFALPVSRARHVSRAIQGTHAMHAIYKYLDLFSIVRVEGLLSYSSVPIVHS